MSVKLVKSVEATKMGNAKSKSKAKGLKDKVKKSTGKESKRSQDILSAQNYYSPENESYDQDLMLLRRTIRRDPEAFILNNLMMCVQFFENYDEEISNIRKTPVSRREAELNEGLLQVEKHVLLPDVLQEHIAHNVRFTSMRQTLRPTVEPLQPVRIYVVLDNVDVTEQNYGPEYSSLNDAVTYNMLLKPCEHRGYVQLQRLEVMPSKKNLNGDEVDDLSCIAEDDDQLYSDGDSILDLKVDPVEKQLPAQDKKSNETQIKSSSTQSLNDLDDDEEIVDFSEDKSRSNVDLHVSNYSNRAKEEADMDQLESARKVRSIPIQVVTSSTSESTPRSKNTRQPAQRNKAHRMVNGSPASSTSSGYRSGNSGADSDSDYGYATITKFSTPKPLKSSGKEHGGSLLTSEIPPTCFKKVTYTRDGKIYDPKEEKKQLLTSKQRRIKVALRRYNYDVWYANSIEFMKHFIDTFIEHLSRSMGFNQETIVDAMVQGCVIYCDKVDVFETSRNTIIEPYEIIPSIWSQWPTCAQEWLDRPRSTWPTYEIIEKIKEFGCYVVPEGFMPKRESNSNHDVEWQLTFPAAERYLETCLSYAQIRVYLIALMLHKTFIRPVDTIFGLTTAHIRNQLFWLIEEHDSPSRWPENRIGECLLKLLKSLYHSISQTEPILSDYFIRDKNLFQNIPKEYLLHTQKQLKRIIENPVMYVFSAMENIRHRQEFFPKIDYEMLLKILTVDSLALVNPALERYVPKPLSKASESDAYGKIYDHPGGFWNSAKIKNDPRQIYGQVRKPVTNKTVINPRKAHDLIIEIPIQCAELHGPRLSALLDFFIRHFIKMAERCHQYRALQQKTIYLHQAERLSILLSEYSRYKEDAREFLQKIKALKKRVANLQSQRKAPETPKRNPDPPTFSLPLRDRFTNESLEQISVTLPVPEEINEYELKGKRMLDRRVTFERLDDKKKVTLAIVHEVGRRQSDESKDTETSNSIDEEKRTVRRNRVVSIADENKEPFITETTYI